MFQKVLMMTREDLDALGVELMAADDAADSRRLAALAWRLYGEVGVIQADIERLHGTPPGHVRAAAGWPGRSASTST